MAEKKSPSGVQGLSKALSKAAAPKPGMGKGGLGNAKLGSAPAPQGQNATEHAMTLAAAEAKAADAKVEAAKAQAEVSKAKAEAIRKSGEAEKDAADATRAQSEAARAQTDAAKAQMSAASSQVEAAKAQADAALAQMDAAKVQAEAAIAQAEATREALELNKQEVVLLKTQTEAAEDELIVARSHARSTTWQAISTTMAAMGVLALGGLGFVAFTDQSATPTPQVESQDVSATAEKAATEVLTPELEKLRDERTKAGEQLDERFAKIAERLALLNYRMSHESLAKSTRISVSSPPVTKQGQANIEQWVAKAKATPIEGSTAQFFEVEGTIKLPAKGAFLTVDAFAGGWWPISPPIPVERMGGFKGKIRLDSAKQPEKIRFVLTEGSKISAAVYEIGGKAPEKG